MELIFHYLFFIGFCFWLALEPGPGFAKLSFEISAFKKSNAICVALGMFSGALPIIILVAVGLGTLLQQTTGLTSTLKIVGALYLFWLALNVVRSKSIRNVVSKKTATNNTVTTKPLIKSFREGFWLVILNPRTVLFYTAFLPLFVVEQIIVPASMQLLALGLVVSIIFLLVDLIFVHLFDAIKSKFIRHNKGSDIVRYLSAAVLSLVGIKLLLDQEN